MLRRDNPDNLYSPGIVTFTPGSKEINVVTWEKKPKKSPKIFKKRSPKPPQPPRKDLWNEELSLKENDDDEVSFKEDDIVTKLLEARRVASTVPVPVEEQVINYEDFKCGYVTAAALTVSEATLTVPVPAEK